MRDRNYERYVDAVETASLLAQQELEEFIGKLDLSKKKASRDALLVFVPALVEKYGDMAEQAAREYYEQERNRQIGGTYHAKSYPMTDESRKDLFESVRYACGVLFDDAEDADGER